MSADLNYTLKRLVRGLYSENHAVKQGFFLASVVVLGRFSSIIEYEKYLAFIQEETKVNSGMKNPEVHAMMMGRMMCASAVIDSKWPNANTKMFVPLIDMLAEIYHAQEFLREAIQVVLVKILKTNPSLLEMIVTKFKLYEEKILATSSDLSLYLTIKDLYSFGKSKELDKLFSFDIFGNKKHLATISTLLKS